MSVADILRRNLGELFRQKLGALCVKRVPPASNKQDTVVAAVNTDIIIVIIIIS